MTVSIHSNPLITPNSDRKIHDAATGFVTNFFSQMVEEMFQEVADASEDSNFETEMYGSFLAQGIAEKIATSPTSTGMVNQIENKMRRQAGLDEIQPLKMPPPQAHKTYSHMTQMTQETHDVRPTTP